MLLDQVVKLEHRRFLILHVCISLLFPVVIVRRRTVLVTPRGQVGIVILNVNRIGRAVG